MAKLIDRQFEQTKTPDEIIPCGIDFAKDLAIAETIISFTVVAMDGEANVTATITDQATKSFDNNQVSVDVRAGAPGKTYKISFLAITSNAHEFAAVVNLAVKKL